MTQQHIEAIARGIAPVLKTFMAGFSERISALETKERLMGPPGPPGPQGERGQDGLSIPGVPGRDGKDGEKGSAGRDGVGLDDLSVRNDETGCHLRLEKGDRVKEVRLPVIRPCGTWKADRTYDVGDTVTWNGSGWTAQGKTAEKPGNGATAWQLIAKEGQSGGRGPAGPSGKDGRDLTNLGPDGAKWGR